MRLISRLLVPASLTFLTACSSLEPPSADPCSWVEPIRFQDQTKEWLRGFEWPPPAYADFDKIAKHNTKVDTFCNPTGGG